MARIFIPPENIQGESASLPEAEAKRLMRVLRLRPGDRVALFDGVKEYSSVITSLGTKSASLKITETMERASESSLFIILGQGFPKGERFEWALQKATELGVSTVVPVIMERSVKRPDAKDAARQLERYRRIATEAAQQSGRVCVPDVPCFMDLPMFLDVAQQADLKIMLYEGEKTVGLREVLHTARDAKMVALLVGPEGGLKPEEVDEAEAAGFVSCGLGPRILRTETAGVAAVSIIQFELGDIG